MIEYHYIITPVIGGIIGYITNDIAIRMLFRPHEAKYVFGIQVPFTPGIIPKERHRIAASIGQSISKNLMNKEVLEKNLLSDEMIGKITSAIDQFFNTQKQNTETLKEFLCHYLSAEEIEKVANSTNKELTTLIHQKLAGADLGGKISHIAVKHVMEKMENFGSSVGDALKDEGIGKGGGFGKMIKRGFENLFGKKAKDNVEEFISMLTEPVENALAKNINEMLENNSQEIMGNLIGNETEMLMSRPMCDLLKNQDEKIAQFKSTALSIYRNIITNQLPRILETLNISKIIETRINDMNPVQAEVIVREVIDKELQSIVWFGAGLGFLIGCVNAFV